MRARSLLITCILLLSLSPLAAAQDAEPTVTLTLQGLPAEPVVLRSNESVEVPFTVGLVVENFACTEDGTLPVALSLGASPGAVDAFTVQPPRLNFSAPPGVYSTATGAYNESLDANVVLSVEGTVPSNHTHTPTVTATFLPNEVTGCQASGDFPSAEATGQFTVHMVAPPAPTNNNTGGGNEDGGGGIPGPGAAALSFALVAAALVARRRLR